MKTNDDFDAEIRTVKDGIMHRGLFTCGGKDREEGDSVVNWRKSSRRYLFITKELYYDVGPWEDIRVDGIKHDENWVYINVFLKGENVEKHLIANVIDHSKPFYPNIINVLYGLELASKNNGDYPKYRDWSYCKEAMMFYFKESALARINCGKTIAPESVGNTTPQNRLKKLICDNFDVLKRQIKYLDADIIVCCGNQNGQNLIKNYLVDKIYGNSVEGSRGVYYSENPPKIIIDSYHPSIRPTILTRKNFYKDTVKPFAEFIKKHPEFRSFR